MAGLMSRNKGKRGEREAVNMLNDVIEQVLASNSFPDEDVAIARSCIQRNQNQSAIGGHDLSGVFGMSVEIKRQEQLNLNAWWRQCVDQAERNKEVPVLLYRQNNQPWRCITFGSVPLPGGRTGQCKIQIEEDAFKTWFYQWVYYKMRSGELPRV